MKIIEYERKCLCATCNGKKSRPGTEPEKCKTCSGTGNQTFRQGMFVMKTTCEACSGEGTKIKHFCGSCNGKGFEKKKMREEVDVPRGVSDGMTIKLAGKGNFNGDLFLKVQVKKSAVFKRAGVNALSDLKISVLDAILGGEKIVTTIEGIQKTVTIPQGIQSGQTIPLKNEGFYLVNSSSKGDHILNVIIDIPKELTAEQRALYQKIKELAK
jgi:molecular chaperone DnaJ